jgi:hypothetical protein
MAWTPTPPDDIPPPEVILGHMQPADTDPPTGYITPSDMESVIQALLSISHVIASQGSARVQEVEAAFNERLQNLQAEIGDPSLLQFGVPEHDLVHFLIRLEARLAALENAGTEIPVSEGFLEVDNYNNGFIRVRDTAGILADGEVHAVTMALATAAGPGGQVINDPPGVPSGTQPVWFDSGGNLGKVVGATGTDVNQTTLRNWVKYGNPAVPNYYLLYVQVDDTTDPTHPRLVVQKVATIA